MYSTKGFTLIELIVVIVLLSVLSAVGIGLFSAPSQYSARLAADQFLTQLRTAQRLALIKQDPVNLLTLTANQNTNNWNMILTQGVTTVNTFDIERVDTNVRTSTSDFSSACSALPLMAFPAAFYFDGYGNAVNSSRVQANTNRRICFQSTSTVEVCIGPSGYAYEGTCQS